MALQNRVLPSGEIVADPARGTYTGNRGILHDAEQRLGRARWTSKAWITCALQHKGWHRQVMTPGTWTELFFLDEAVALAAGHRPCALCRRPAYEAYRRAWGGAPRVPAIDAALHKARLNGRAQRRYQADCASLPDGCLILIGDQPHLILGPHALPYTPAGYRPATPRPQGPVVVMTPQPTVAVLAQGYTADLHVTAQHLTGSDQRPAPGGTAGHHP